MERACAKMMARSRLQSTFRGNGVWFFCPTCEELDLFCPDLEEEEDNEPEKNYWHHRDEFRNPVRSRVLDSFHTPMNEFWRTVLYTDTLSAGRLRYAGGIQWVEFPLRNMDICTMNCDGFFLNGVEWSGNVPVGPVFHNTSLQSLVHRNIWAPGSSGILIDKRLLGGSRKHGPHSGVNFYLDGGYETFSPGDGRCQLELFVTRAVQLGGRREHCYCVTCEPGEVCDNVCVTSLRVRYSDVPEALKVW